MQPPRPFPACQPSWHRRQVEDWAKRENQPIASTAPLSPTDTGPSPQPRMRRPPRSSGRQPNRKAARHRSRSRRSESPRDRDLRQDIRTKKQQESSRREQEVEVCAVSNAPHRIAARPRRMERRFGKAGDPSGVRRETYGSRSTRSWCTSPAFGARSSAVSPGTTGGGTGAGTNGPGGRPAVGGTR